MNTIRLEPLSIVAVFLFLICGCSSGDGDKGNTADIREKQLHSDALSPPIYFFDPSWPQLLPNSWKIGGITGLAIDVDDSVWVYNRPDDLTALELFAEHSPPIAECCVHPPALIHFDKNGRVIGSLDVPEGHGLDVDSEGYLYTGQDTVRKYDPKTGGIIWELDRAAESEDGSPIGLQEVAKRSPGVGSVGPVYPFLPQAQTVLDGESLRDIERRKHQFRRKYPPDSPLIVGRVDDVIVDEEDAEIYVADSYLGGRVLVFDLHNQEYKRGWGSYGKALKLISLDDEDHFFEPGGTRPKDFGGHLALNISNDDLVYVADRQANRIQVMEKDGTFVKEYVIAEHTGGDGSAGGVAFSADQAQRFLLVPSITNNKIFVVDRVSGNMVDEIGGMGQNGGLFFGLHVLVVDSENNIYTGEVLGGQRVQRFVPAESVAGSAIGELFKNR